MQVSMNKCKKKLASLWFSGALFLFLILLLQTMLGRYVDQVEKAWGWFLPTIMPTISLIFGVFALDTLGKGIKKKTVDRYVFRISFSLSAVYLFFVVLTLLARPFTSYSPIELMQISNLWLGPLQGLVSASVGIFFFKKEAQGA